jgi:transposase
MPTAIRRATAAAARARATARREQLQARRLQAAGLFAQGVRPAQVARQLGVSKQSASHWHATWNAGGIEALTSKGPTGLRPRLSDADLQRLEQALLQGAATHGFTGDLWTLPRITTVIHRLTGVRLHPGHVWSILHQRMAGACNAPSAAPPNATSRPSSGG